MNLFTEQKQTQGLGADLSLPKGKGGMDGECGVSRCALAFGGDEQRGPAAQHRALHPVTCDGTREDMP